MRLLIAGQNGFLDEARDVLRVRLTEAPWVSVDNTDVRHRATNGACAQIANDHIARFGATASKSRLTFLDLLRGGHADYMINAAALACMRGHATRPVIARLAVAADTYFVDQAAWQVHLDRLGITSRVEADLAAIQDPGR
jgi:hypothetical protein